MPHIQDITIRRAAIGPCSTVWLPHRGVMSVDERLPAAVVDEVVQETLDKAARRDVLDYQDAGDTGALSQLIRVQDGPEEVFGLVRFTRQTMLDADQVLAHSS